MKAANHQLERIPSLDGLRAISISLVLISHITLGLKENFNNSLVKKIFGLFILGHLGVMIFFVISGFIITTLLLQELDYKKHINLAKFYYRRTLRIFPPYYFFLLILILLHLFEWINVPSKNLIAALTYTTNYYMDLGTWYTGHTWSLAVEEQFYLLWPLTLVVLRKRKALIAALLIILISPLIRFYYNQISLQEFYRFEAVADSLAVGCLLAGMRAWLHRQQCYQKILGSKLLILAPFIILYISLAPNHPSFCPMWLYALAGLSLVNILIAVCIDWSITNHMGIIGRALNSKPVITVGVASYSIYLWQQLFTNPVGQSLYSRFPINILLIFVMAFMSYRYIEKPWLRARQRWEPSLFSASTRSNPLAPNNVESLGTYPKLGR